MVSLLYLPPELLGVSTMVLLSECANSIRQDSVFCALDLSLKTQFLGWFANCVDSVLRIVLRVRALGLERMHHRAPTGGSRCVWGGGQLSVVSQETHLLVGTDECDWVFPTACIFDVYVARSVVSLHRARAQLWCQHAVKCCFSSVVPCLLK